MITMYRSGFTIDNGPFRRLDDPSNADFLRDLARGITPRELFEDGTGTGTGTTEGSGSGSGSPSPNGDMEVGLVDKRHMEYEDDKNRTGGGAGGSSSSATTTTTAFSGVGQSLGASETSSPVDGIINVAGAGADTATGADADADAKPPAVDESKPTTTIQIRLLTGKRLIVKCNLDDPVRTLVLHINAAMAGAAAAVGAAAASGAGESYVLSSGYPPRVLSDLDKTIEECGLKGAQVVQKKA